tara:strand:- start:838 stop:1902 length:1065 start_codon:yes stop_codon:yes gene_type:complete
MSTNEEYAEEQYQEPENEIVQEEPSSQEDKFLGIKNTVVSNEEAVDFDVEIIDDRPEQDRKIPRSEEQRESDQSDLEKEIDDVDERVKKRIGKLKYEWHEERRAKEAAEKIRDESVNYAKQQAEENRRLQALVQRGESALMQQVKAKAEAQLASAKESHKKAYETGDTDQITDATQEMLKAQQELKVADDHFVRQRVQEQQAPQQQNFQQQQQQPIPQQQPQTIDPKAVAWLKVNSWFGSDDQKEMTALAYGIHETLVTKEGVSPQSDQYYQEVDKRMRVRFPDYFGVENSNEDSNLVTETVTPRNTQSVVAPSTRNNGSKPRKVQLTSTQVSLAKRLGISPERYAKELIKEKI